MYSADGPRQPKGRMNGSLAELLLYWTEERVGEKELVVLILETIRDDISQARTTDGKRVVDPRSMQEYLDEQIAHLRRLGRED